MTKRSAGIVLYRWQGARLELLLVHPGGPFWAKKDEGAWSIPKGEYETGEEPLAVARREFEEELGAPAPEGEIIELGELIQPSRKLVTAFALEGDFEPTRLKSNQFELEWPPRSGRIQNYPEIDHAQWFAPDEALAKILPGQRPFIDRLLARFGRQPGQRTT
jgi:predicted NUDIX family NTP pyrophosphohydrolase